MLLNKAKLTFYLSSFTSKSASTTLSFSPSTSLTVSGLLSLAGFLVHRRCQFVEWSGDSLYLALIVSILPLFTASLRSSVALAAYQQRQGRLCP